MTHESGWRTIETAPDMRALWLFHEYYSHGRSRLGYRNHKGIWIGVNADGTERPLNFDPSHYIEAPSPPEPL